MYAGEEPDDGARGGGAAARAGAGGGGGGGGGEGTRQTWEEEGRGNELLRALRTVRENLPFVGLVSQLTSPGGLSGKDFLLYPEFCRSLYDSVALEFHFATEDLEKLDPEMGKQKCINFCLWVAAYGPGVMREEGLLQEVQGIGTGSDLEYFVDKFEKAWPQEVRRQALEPAEAKAPVDIRARFAVEALVKLLKLKDSEALPPPYADPIRVIVCQAFPSADPAAVDAAVAAFPKT